MPVDPTLFNMQLLLLAVVAVLLFSMIPRFIIGIRELYHRDRRRRWQGIDTGFGVFSEPTASRSAVVPANAFADLALGETDADSDAFQLEVLGDNMSQA